MGDRPRTRRGARCADLVPAGDREAAHQAWKRFGIGSGVGTRCSPSPPHILTDHRWERFPCAFGNLWRNGFGGAVLLWSGPCAPPKLGHFFWPYLPSERTLGASCGPGRKACSAGHEHPSRLIHTVSTCRCPAPCCPRPANWPWVLPTGALSPTNWRTQPLPTGQPIPANWRLASGQLATALPPPRPRGAPSPPPGSAPWPLSQSPAVRRCALAPALRVHACPTGYIYIYRSVYVDAHGTCMYIGSSSSSSIHTLSACLL